MVSRRQIDERNAYAEILVDEWLKGMEIVAGHQADAGEMQALFEAWCDGQGKARIGKITFRRVLRRRGVFVWSASTFCAPIMLNLRKRADAGLI